MIDQFGVNQPTPYPNISMINPNIPRFPQSQPTQMQPQNNGIIWVQGIEGAKAYQLPANSNVLLLDSEADRFYIKSTDTIGMTSNFRVFEFTEVVNNPTKSNIDTSKFVTRDELDQILADLNSGKKSGGKSNGKQLISTNESNAKPTIAE